MFEKLNRLRTERERAKAKFEEAKVKYEEAEEKLKAEMATSILDVVARKDFSPEQLAEYLGVADKEKAASSKSKKKEAKLTKDEDAEPLPFTDDTDARDTENDGIMEDILNESF